MSITYAPNMTAAVYYTHRVPAGIMKIEDWYLPRTDKVIVGWATKTKSHTMEFSKLDWPSEEQLTALMVAMRLSTC